MSEIVVMKDVCKSYYSGNEEVKVLKNINLTVKKGEFVSVLGPSGSGKTTLMNIIGCLDVPTSGKYLLCGKDVSEMDETELAAVRNREIGFVFQNFFLLPRLTAIQNVELPLVYSNIPQKERRRKAEKMLYRVGLGDKMHNLPNQLSGGQQQRVAIARALVTEPSIILADEPTGSLDQKTGAGIIEYFERLNEEGKTIIMITHDINVAGRAKRTINILDGVLTDGG
ncbi:ABC transporter ATP-binding protein [Thermoclostridium stercorarium]|uniref:ABC transporter ATP-binding protein n=1 Tax=Thermoclostridium stercorarium TaxID=1510 RepID=UPI0022497CAC|nr:ABC transporter ATP-binding protein [Thermoclostridium stercorarium]UZQ87006.1 ABC transporter ATP-binding protein [Thermoclostridium stercorarium]